jgi:oligopeptide/dipeptide ABC transporter ATP-binding protein
MNPMRGTAEVPLLEVQGLTTEFNSENGVVRAVDGVSFDLSRGSVLALVGESGCGKSVTSLSIMRLVSDPPGRIVAGTVKFNGEDLLRKSEREMRAIRGNDISMIFQEPMTSLNPVMTVGAQISEAVLLHTRMSRLAARVKAIEALGRVGIPSPEQRFDAYPHQLSGGMRQRVMIAMAMACNSQLLIADEPTTALDVTIQAQILRLMREMRAGYGTAILLITHDMSVVAELADEVLVMYAGRIVERASAKELFKSALHPYTSGLLDSIPRIDADRDRLPAIDGVVPNPLDLPEGCSFRPRCPRATAACAAAKAPPLREAGSNPAAASHLVACWNARAATNAEEMEKIQR